MSVKKMMNFMLISSMVFCNLWGEALVTTCFLQNRIPHKKTSKTPMSCGNVINIILNT